MRKKRVYRKRRAIWPSTAHHMEFMNALRGVLGLGPITGETYVREEIRFLQPFHATPRPSKKKEGAL
jgi:hypothetical protein